MPTQEPTEPAASPGPVAPRDAGPIPSAALGAIGLAARLPRRVRRVLLAPVAALADRPSDRVAGPVRTSPVALAARIAGGPRTRAEAMLTADAVAGLGTRTRARILALACRAGLWDTLESIAASRAEDTSPALEAARAEAAYREGRFHRSAEHAAAAASGGLREAGEQGRRAAGMLAILTPGWVPPLPAGSPRPDPVTGRILHLVSSSLPFTSAGYNIRTASVVAAQREAGLDPRVAARTGYRTAVSNGGSARRDVDGIPTAWLGPLGADGRIPDRMQAASARLALDLAREIRPAVVQATTDFHQAQIALALREPLGVPVVYEVRGFWEETWASTFPDEAAALATERYRLTRETETAAMVAADAVVTLSELMRSELIARGCAPDRVVVVPNAVRPERFEPQPRDAALAASLGIEPGDPVMGYVSSLNAYEGVRYLLAAAAELRARLPRLKVLVVGDGPELEALRAEARRLGLDDGTALLPGRVPHGAVQGYYSCIDVFVVPRTNHRVARLVTPLKPFEAMALGKAVIVSDLPALREIVVPGETGDTFRAEDASDLAEVAGRLLDDAGLRERIGAQARAWVLAERTWAANGRRYRELYERLGAA